MQTCLNRVIPALVALAGAASISIAQCEVTALAVGPTALDNLGRSVASDYDVMVVGIPGYNMPNAANAGAVRVYSRPWDEGEWTAGPLLTEGAAAVAGNSLGVSVDIDMDSAGGTIVAGAPIEAVNGLASAGVVRVFQRVAGVWTMTALISNPFPNSSDQFGATVSLSGDELFIGCPGDDTAGVDRGTVYAYRRVAGVWTRIDNLTMGSFNTGCRMGEAVDVSGQWAIVGVPKYATAGHTEQGAVVVYRKQANGHWAYSTTWGAGKPDGTRTGAAVSVGTNWIGYSMPGEQASTNSGVGRVCVYFNLGENGDGDWATNIPQMSQPDDPTVTGFGSSLEVSNGSVLVGATGGAYRAFLFSGGSTPLVRIPAPADSSSAVGTSVALARFTILVGDPNAASGSSIQAGKVYMHEYEHFIAGTDLCSMGSEILAWPGYFYEGCTTLASPSPAAEVAGVCGQSAASRDKWMKIKITPAAPLIVDTIGSEFDTTLSLYTSCPASGGTVVACDDDSAGNYMSRLVIPAQGPGYVYVRVAGFNGAHGAFRFNITRGCGNSDFNGDGDYGTDADIEAFFACLGGNCPFFGGSSDFNGDGDFGTDADIEAFFSVLGGGNC